MARKMKDSGIEWIGMIPQDWETKKLKYCSRFIQEKYSVDYGDLPYIGMENIESWNGRYVATDSVFDKNQSDLFLPDDILWGKLRPYLAKVYHAKEKGCCSGEFCVIRLNERYDVRYFWNLLISSEFVFMVDRSTYGTKMPRANANFIKNLFVPVPPFTEQRRIASFLDARCALIDAAIDKTRASIEEYRKLKQAIITEAVTKGVRGKKRRMKDSGIEWIGEIPEEWETHLLKHSLKWKSEKGMPDATVLSLYRDFGVIPKDSRDDNHNVTSLDTGSYKIVDKGDLVINKMKAWQGSLAISKYSGIVSPAYHVCTVVNDNLVIMYLHYLLRNQLYFPEYSRLSTGMRIGQWDLSFDDFKNLPFVLPSKDEQQEIVNYIDNKLQKIDSLIDCKDHIISELETLKKSIIFEYVTGKKEVPA